jgi:AhpD family alkylhydroperoxidase
MLSAVRNHSALDAGVRELVILRVAVLNRAPYEFDAHVPHALAAGCSQADIDATRLQPLPAHAGWSPAAVAALALADAMTRSVQVPDTVFDAVAVHFDAQGKVELVAAIAAYNMVSRFLEALHVGH